MEKSPRLLQRLERSKERNKGISQSIFLILSTTPLKLEFIPHDALPINEQTKDKIHLEYSVFFPHFLLLLNLTRLNRSKGDPRDILLIRVPRSFLFSI